MRVLKKNLHIYDCTTIVTLWIGLRKKRKPSILHHFGAWWQVVKNKLPTKYTLHNSLAHYNVKV